MLHIRAYRDARTEKPGVMQEFSKGGKQFLLYIYVYILYNMLNFLNIMIFCTDEYICLIIKYLMYIQIYRYYIIENN